MERNNSLTHSIICLSLIFDSVHPAKQKENTHQILAYQLNQSPILQYDNSEKKKSNLNDADFENIILTIQDLSIFSFYLLYTPVTMSFTILPMTKWHFDYT